MLGPLEGDLGGPGSHSAKATGCSLTAQPGAQRERVRKSSPWQRSEPLWGENSVYWRVGEMLELGGGEEMAP